MKHKMKFEMGDIVWVDNGNFSRVFLVIDISSMKGLRIASPIDFINKTNYEELVDYYIIIHPAITEFLLLTDIFQGIV